MSNQSAPLEVKVPSVLAAEEVVQQAEEFFALPELSRLHDASRLRAVRSEIEATGTYRHTRAELETGARIAWRNHARCVGRTNWRALQLLDFRDRTTPDGIAEACWEHLRHSTNNGRLKAVISVFPQQRPDGAAVRVLNPQLLRYAGYRRRDGSVLGDPLHCELTEHVVRAGWEGAGTAFDLLPLVLHVPGHGPALYEVPQDAVLEVPISHPEYPWFGDLGLKWMANPAVSNMALVIGGVTYTAAPFSGWYLSSEIGARNFSDTSRYDMLPTVARKMGLDISHDRTLWKDRALVELTYAVQHSYRSAGVHILDHHTAAQQFIHHIEREEAAGRSVPAQWSWINPPLSGSTTPTFHREYDAPDLGARPNFVAQESPAH
ncbi:nitric oxide synthase oxygenase [Streptomyces populi]|uniref:nitric oxide synthase oxygenase n=1 Tax=Streptomyces populi TaxID=2058924 RepID=UPI0035D6B489